MLNSFTEVVLMGTGRGTVGGMYPEDEQGYRTLVETAQEGIGLVDTTQGTIKYCNETYARILGLSPLELVGRSFFDFRGVAIDPPSSDVIDRLSLYMAP